MRAAVAFSIDDGRFERLLGGEEQLLAVGLGAKLGAVTGGAFLERAADVGLGGVVEGTPAKLSRRWADAFWVAAGVAAGLPVMVVLTVVVEASEEAPPPSCAWSPSPATAGEETGEAADAALALVLK